ncbi:unnamed protein product [Paramecium pentaurelia]|uniref:Transmembrane protein n=1 Tax=Paramecium pentaurelia TaxID=43138 RepID=A0A8S1VPZ8_9CILI|nr:unnamed protein product [Paramecium pentaurelia]
MKIHVILQLFVLCKCIKFSLTVRCACNEYDEEYCISRNYCSWNGSSCIDLQCQYQKEEYCNTDMTEYQCKWNETLKVCQSYSYQCSELKMDECQNSMYYLDCFWFINQCVPHECKDHIDCNPDQCSSSPQGCAHKVDNLNCSSYTQDICIKYDGYGSGCAYSIMNGCFDLRSSCQDYSESISFCNTMCYYDIHSQQCIPQECSQITVKSKCKSFISEIPNQQFIPCKWSNGQCKELDIEDYKDIDLNKCKIYSINSFWQDSTLTCKLCNSFVSHPKYNQKQRKNVTKNNNQSALNDTQDILENQQNQQNGIYILQLLLISYVFII